MLLCFTWKYLGNTHWKYSMPVNSATVVKRKEVLTAINQ